MILYIFHTLKFILLQQCTNEKNNLPALDSNQDPSIGNSTRYPLHHRHWRVVHISEYIFWLRKGKKEPANFTGSNPTVSTTANTIQGTELLCWTATTFWVWQISKSANCKLHPPTYLYMHRSRWLVCHIYSCHWRPLFPLWCNIPAHAPGHL